MFRLSRQATGFDGVAIVNTGLQWCGPVLLVAASLGSVAIPAFSRLISAGDEGRSRQLRGLLIRVNLVLSSELRFS